MISGDRPAPTGGFDVVLAVVGVVVVAMATITFGGASLAAAISGGTVSGGVSDWLAAAGRLVSAPGDPTLAWGDAAVGLPGPLIYWLCTLVVAAAVLVLASLGWWLWRRWFTPQSRRFGVPADARVATARDVRTLAVASTVPPTGRMLLGRFAPRGPILASEDRERHPAKHRRAIRRQGDRGSIALIGPTRSGKTVLASAGIIAWDGPVVALSVKRDLYDATAAARRKRGDLAVFDPGGVTGLPTARWTPLRDVTTTSGAARAGRALAQAIPRHGVSGGDFWASHGETLTTAYMALAGLSRLLDQPDGSPRPPLTIGRLATWAYLHVGISEPTVHELIRQGLPTTQPVETRLLAKEAMTKLMAFEGEDPKIRASIYATARLAFEAWTEPAVAHSAALDPRSSYHSDELWDHEPRYIDLDWLMNGPPDRSNTLYLAAPSTEFARLAPVLGGLLGDIREQIHAWDLRGRPLTKPLLIVIDEAGQLELQWLPEEVSTIAGLGAMFVTGWQSKSQISHRYGTLADAVLGGHRSKIIFNGTDDPSTLDYVARVAGTDHVPQRGWSADTGGGRKTVSEHVQREDLIPAHIIRQLPRHEAVLLHGTLPPIHLRLIRWWEDKQLRALVPRAPDGSLARPPSDGTCPLGRPRTKSAEPVLDPTVIAESVERIPGSRAEPQPSRRVTQGRVDPHQQQLDLDGPPDSGHDKQDVEETGNSANRVAGYCERCGARVAVGSGRSDRMGEREIVRCAPKCP